MSEKNGYLLRKATGDMPAESEQEIKNWFLKGQCKPADFIFDFSRELWLRVGDLPVMADLFGARPPKIPEKRLIYFMSAGTLPALTGPFSTREMQQKIQGREVCQTTWVFVEGDKEWRQMRAVKILMDMLEPLPQDKPPAPENSDGIPGLDLGEEKAEIGILSPEAGAGAPGGAVPSDDFVEREEATMAFSTLGLDLKVDAPPSPPAPPAAPARPPATPPKPPIPAAAPKPAPEEGLQLSLEGQIPQAPAVSAAVPAARKKNSGEDTFDGITAEIPTDPIWLVKKANSEAVSGPFRFLDVVKFLEEGRITKNDKISKVGTNRFVKIQQQYEFNVKFTLETVVEHGVEKQKIFIKRRHPRVPYFTELQVLTKTGMVAGNCVNISAGGILIEIPKAEFNLGDILEVKLLPGLIPRAIPCKCLVIGKIPKIPPGFALKFEQLKNEDKEAIEYFVNESLKREMSK